MRVQSLGQEVSLEKKMATSIFRYSCLGNPWTEEPDRLQYTGSQRAGHDLVTKQQQQKNKSRDATKPSPRSC